MVPMEGVEPSSIQLGKSSKTPVNTYILRSFTSIRPRMIYHEFIPFPKISVMLCHAFQNGPTSCSFPLTIGSPVD